jgi:phenylalanine-4-hydroxylase
MSLAAIEQSVPSFAGGAGTATEALPAGPERASEVEIRAPRRDAAPAPEIVQLVFEHPANDDPAYQRRRSLITEVSLRYREGEPVPRVEYTDEEDHVWRTVRRRIDELHARFACRRYRDAWDDLALDRERLPQLADVNAVLGPRTGFRMRPVTGFVSPRSFFGELARGVFLSTQYIRYAGTPLFSPDPDVIHELIGHAPTLLDPVLAELNRHFGRTALRVDDATLEKVIRMHWFTLETGLAEEDGRTKAYGAAILSSPEEMDHCLTRATLRPFDIEAICGTSFEPTVLQDQLFVSRGFDATIATVSAWLDAL